MVEKTSPLDVPLEVRSRMDAWYALFMRAMYSHYFFGVVGVAASTISAATGGCARQSTCCCFRDLFCGAPYWTEYRLRGPWADTR